MPPYEVPDRIDEAFVQELVDRKQRENKHFEFKQQLNIKTDRQKQRFLAHVSAFANTEGGFLIYGIKQGDGQLKGKASEICDVSCPENDDDLQLKIEDMIRTGISPGIVDADVEIVVIDTDNRVLVIHVPESQSKPHMVTHSGLNKIYRRHSSGIYEPDLEELRLMFDDSDSQAKVNDRIRNFREDRALTILRNKTPFLAMGPVLVFHIVPAESLFSNQDFELAELSERVALSHSRPLWNVDGLALGKNNWFFYQIFRNGIIECVHSIPKEKDGLGISISGPERYLRNSDLPTFFNWLQILNVSPPYFVMQSLINVEGRYFILTEEEKQLVWRIGYDSYLKPCQTVRERILYFKERKGDSFDLRTDKLLRPIFNSAWQAFGWPHSLNYNKNGSWRHRDTHRHWLP